jgi:hypothetical protein
MLRKETVLPPIKEEWTKYFVNDIECKRDAIYQTILDHKLHNGEIKLGKKYHYKHHEEKTIEIRQNDGYGSSVETQTTKNNDEKNTSADFSLNTKVFAEKIDAKSADYKLLTEKMSLVLDIFFEAQKDNAKHSTSLRSAIKDCMSFFIEKSANSKGPYDNMVKDISVELFSFLFDTLTLFMSTLDKIDIEKNKKDSEKTEQPSLNYDTSSLEKWNDNWDNHKKSKYFHKYLDVMLDQTDTILKHWLKHPVFATTLDSNQIQKKFNDFKDVLKSLQKKLKEHDEALGIKSGIAAFFSFFSRNHTQPKTNDAKQDATPALVRPK